MEKHVCLFQNERPFSNRNLISYVGCVLFLVFDLKKKYDFFFVITICDRFSMWFLFMQELSRAHFKPYRHNDYENTSQRVLTEA